ncbi:MAG: hypothetical protein ABH848_04335 [Candidatus Omnitrophota bacterium]
MKKNILISLIIAIFSFLIMSESMASEESILILREAKESGKDMAAVEAHLLDNILTVKITARMEQTKPKIYNALIVGPKLGRLNIEKKEVLLQGLEEEPYPTKKRRGFISFDPKSEKKRGKGTLTRELVDFKIPKDRLVKGKKYQLWVQIESLQRGGGYATFKFDLEDLAELVLEKEMGEE